MSRLGRRQLIREVAGVSLTGVWAAFLGGCDVVQSSLWPRKVARVGFLAPARVPAARLDALRAGLRDLGWIEGRNLSIHERYADGHNERLPELAAELVHFPVEVIVGPGGPNIDAARQESATTPIVVTTDADPVAEGLATSLARPGGNVTGLTIFAPELNAKRLELLLEMAPGRARIAVWLNLGNPGTAQAFADAESAALQLGLELQPFDVRSPDDLAAAAEHSSAWPAQALTVLPDSFLVSQRDPIVKLAARNSLPAAFAAREWVDAGGLMSYGPNQVALYQRAAWFVDRILRGANPADLPFEQPTTFDLVVNVKTMQTLGLTIPPSVLPLVTEWVQ